MIDLHHQELHRAYLQQRLGCTLEPTAQFIANTAPYGVAGFERWNGSDIEIHFAGERSFLTRAFLRACALYVFQQLGCDRVTGRLPADRPKGKVIAERVGFKHEGTIRRGHNGADILIYGMLKEECRWL